jgi:CO/xanthine dehydrogenase FAD-binding subunit
VATFTYHEATGLDDALTRLSEPNRLPIGDGTDLLVTIEGGLVALSGVVDVRAVPESLGGREVEDGALRIGGSVGTDGETRLVLGGVSPRPYRVYGSVEGRGSER